MLRYMRRLFLIFSIVLAACSSLAALAAPRVAVSIAPVHSMVSAVMQGVAEPILLIPAGQSPHDYSLKPSAMINLSQADLIVWTGRDFELSLVKPLGQMAATRQISLLDLKGMHLLEARHSGIWDSGHNHAERESDHEVQHGPGTIVDPHIWLSAENALVVARAVASELLDLDPDNADLYRQNIEKLVNRINNTRRELEQSLEPVMETPYLVFHDAYQYFEDEYGLSPLGAVTLNPERKPGARTLMDIRQSIKDRGARCIFHEPQFEPRQVRRIAEETGIRVGELDPMGSRFEPGPDLWFRLMFALRDSLLGCVHPEIIGPA